MIPRIVTEEQQCLSLSPGKAAIHQRGSQRDQARAGIKEAEIILIVGDGRTKSVTAVSERAPAGDRYVASHTPELDLDHRVILSPSRAALSSIPNRAARAP